MWTNILLSVLIIILIIFAVYFCCCVSAALIRFILEPSIALCNCNTRLDGKTALVTGGNSGIGFETAKDLANRGARVIIADINNAETSVANIIQSTDNPKVQYIHVDLSKFKSIRMFADKFNNTVDQLDILVNNAGCLMIKKYTTDDGMDLTMQVNYLGPFFMTKLIMEKLLKSPQCRIVNVTSGVYTIGSVDFEDLSGNRTSNFFLRYANSKLCVSLWTKALARHFSSNVSAFYVHPGMVTSNMLFDGKSSYGRFINATLGRYYRNCFEGAQTTIHCCVAPCLEKYSGSYFSNCELQDKANLQNESDLVEKLWVQTNLFLNNYEVSIKSCESIKTS
ncbi:unnamed protein product [Leptidea sinapis]|uniref:Uncharacterized protein n=1 Tax=Leptidea sinapis TaxID=189913 RepID=A0A5E4Q8S0_9NEOP|nr:unnamed protein product [Leptidea sinapis]